MDKRKYSRRLDIAKKRIMFVNKINKQGLRMRKSNKCDIKRILVIFIIMKNYSRKSKCDKRK